MKILVLCALWATTAHGEQLTLARAVELAAIRSPATAAMTAETESLASSSEADALSLNMIFESDFENFAGSGSASGTDLLESTLRVSRVIELGDKASLRRGVGAAERERLA